MCCAGCCVKLGGDSFKTAYGDWLCEDCWDEYVCSDAGKVEYLIGICHGFLPLKEFDADFLGEVAISYRQNRDKLNLSAEQLTEIEQKAVALGIL